ncbi:hypothetical protein LIA77_04240 [Sarocladium implicatum]|nr:hypothetical protein LIA77_04240 [Sarocladium implicatum]
MLRGTRMPEDELNASSGHTQHVHARGASRRTVNSNADPRSSTSVALFDTPIVMLRGTMAGYSPREKFCDRALKLRSSALQSSICRIEARKPNTNGGRVQQCLQLKYLHFDKLQSSAASGIANEPQIATTLDPEMRMHFDRLSIFELCGPLPRVFGLHMNERDALLILRLMRYRPPSMLKRLEHIIACHDGLAFVFYSPKRHSRSIIYLAWLDFSFYLRVELDASPRGDGRGQKMGVILTLTR